MFHAGRRASGRSSAPTPRLEENHRDADAAKPARRVPAPRGLGARRADTGPAPHRSAGAYPLVQATRPAALGVETVSSSARGFGEISYAGSGSDGCRGDSQADPRDSLVARTDEL